MNYQMTVLTYAFTFVVVDFQRFMPVSGFTVPADIFFDISWIRFLVRFLVRSGQILVKTDQILVKSGQF